MGGHIGAGEVAHAAENCLSHATLTACCVQPGQHAYVRGASSWISSEMAMQSVSALHDLSSFGNVRGGGCVLPCGSGAISISLHLPPWHVSMCDQLLPIGAGEHVAPSF